MRKTASVVIAGGPDNRDAGKVFEITELPAIQIEKFGMRALIALGSSGLKVPDDLVNAGIIGVALVGYQAFMNAQFASIEPLMDEMLTTVQYAPSKDVRMPFNPMLVEEMSTLMALRKAFLELHTGFTLAELVQRLQRATSAKISDLSAMPTSPES